MWSRPKELCDLYCRDCHALSRGRWSCRKIVLVKPPQLLDLCGDRRMLLIGLLARGLGVEEVVGDGRPYNASVLEGEFDRRDPVWDQAINVCPKLASSTSGPHVRGAPAGARPTVAGA